MKNSKAWNTPRRTVMKSPFFVREFLCFIMALPTRSHFPRFQSDGWKRTIPLISPWRTWPGGGVWATAFPLPTYFSSSPNRCAVCSTWRMDFPAKSGITPGASLRSPRSGLGRGLGRAGFRPPGRGLLSPWNPPGDRSSLSGKPPDRGESVRRWL